MNDRLGGWQCWVDFYEGYVIKTFKNRQEIEETVRRYLSHIGKLEDLDDRVNAMLSDIEDSTRLINDSHIPKSYLANLEFLKDGTVRQTLVTPLKEILIKHDQDGNIVELTSLAEKLVSLIHQLWGYGIHEKSFKFDSNMGILQNEVVLIDPFEITDDENYIIAQLNKKSWQKKERYSDYLSENAIDILVNVVNAGLTEINYRKLWRSSRS